ncbi:MAG TPA: DUF1330 domain-containing protein [Gemmatimonadaceae bacterium]|jgi:uncharacterized protein (DUF1330 family)
MPAFVIVQVEIEDSTSYAEYVKLVPPSIAAYGGRFVVRGGKTETLEGSWSPKRLVILEFPSVEQAKKWWASEEYAAGKALRQRSAKTEMIVAEGV